MRMMRVLACFCAAALLSAEPQPPSPRFDLARDTYLIDEPVPIVLGGLPPGARGTVSVRGGAQQDPWTSHATFVADAAGRIDLATMAPVSGKYSGVDAMGLFWSAEREGSTSSEAAEQSAGPSRWSMSAEIDGQIVARANVTRNAVDPTVKIAEVRERGLVGTYYEPPGGGRRPAFIVLSGSGGGIPPAAGPAGGLASRGYAVLALAYFNAGSLPRTLSNIPLEYFGTALEWLASHPAVDPERIGVLGVSRGGELALLLGVLYPHIHMVVGYVPSNVVWRGCCDRFSTVAWTIGGQPVAAMPPMGARDPGAALRAEIQVEKIQGPVLLLSGKDDGVWESTRMADAVVDRLKRNHFAFAFQHLAYEHAGHAIGRPFTSTMTINSLRHPLTGNVMHMGGTPAGTARAREDSWRQVLGFIDTNLAHRVSSASNR
jgi:dienelactone hydrolase